jgi:hypothetical protein
MANLENTREFELLVRDFTDCGMSRKQAEIEALKILTETVK